MNVLLILLFIVACFSLIFSLALVAEEEAGGVAVSSIFWISAFGCYTILTNG